MRNCLGTPRGFSDMSTRRGFQQLMSVNRGLDFGLFAFGLLAGLICSTVVQDAVDNLLGVDVRISVVADLVRHAESRLWDS